MLRCEDSAELAGTLAGLMSAVTGLTLWGVLLLGVAATGTGALCRVPLAVLTLTALASFEAVTALPRHRHPARPGPRLHGRPLSADAGRPV